ncbi:hypothetical protein BT96DRAFT_975425 [Gymnopus androsaceus JB14]|uniref:Uncharacterized protein n=1 Tax=Gymnopus androsaceus JB14 TaxID=1447944 RepID=A0A6A4HTL7_9AGAR|nr:hypothetical protein BT96DRAFT_975425 [Gymnopus androsaceus JB14]
MFPLFLSSRLLSLKPQILPTNTFQLPSKILSSLKLLDSSTTWSACGVLALLLRSRWPVVVLAAVTMAGHCPCPLQDGKLMMDHSVTLSNPAICPLQPIPPLSTPALPTDGP